MKHRPSSYVDVSGRLREGILSGTYPSGSRLPSERALEKQFGVSRVTVRQALSVLERERLIQRRHGSGTYVSPKPTRRIPLMIDFTGSVRDHAPTLRRRLLLWRRQPAGEAAEHLGLEPEAEILYAERVDEVDGVPVAWDQAHIAASYARRLSERDLARVDFVETWTRRERFTVEACRQTVEATAATASANRHLGIPRGRPLLKCMEVFLAEHGRPAGLYISYYHPKHICITSHYRWTDATEATHA